MIFSYNESPNTFYIACNKHELFSHILSEITNKETKFFIIN